MKKKAQTERHYCHHCGGRLAPESCPKCETEILGDWLFCATCGYDLYSKETTTQPTIPTLAAKATKPAPKATKSKPKPKASKSKARKPKWRQKTGRVSVFQPKPKGRDDIDKRLIVVTESQMDWVQEKWDGKLGEFADWLCGQVASRDKFGEQVVGKGRNASSENVRLTLWLPAGSIDKLKNTGKNISAILRWIIEQERLLA